MLPDKGLPTSASTCWNSWPTERAKNKVAFLKASGMNLAAMVAAQGLLVACCSHSRPKTIFLKECRVILTQLLLLMLIISEHSR